MLKLYSLIYSAALSVLFPFELAKRPKGGKAAWLREKFGVFPFSPEGGSPLIWVHAVSVGETITSVYFINEFIKRHPGYRVVVSTITDTGRAVARERLKGTCEVIYLPFDLAWIIRKAVKALRPSLFINMETELWPNLICTMKESGVPVAVMNGRISDKSFKGYRKIRPFIKRVLGCVDLFCMQNEEYTSRVIKLGAEEGRVEATGNFKFDISVKGSDLPWARALRGPVVLAGSTHAGEEDLLVSAFLELKERFEGLNFVIAPRHPQRFSEVENLLIEKKVPFIKRSTLGDEEGSEITGSVVLMDTIGELSSAFKACDIAVIGGSFIPHGGQNPLEPAYWGRPVVCGPHMFNFPFIKDFYDQGAALKTDSRGLKEALERLLSSEEERNAMGGKAKAILVANQGAVGKAIDALERRVGVL